MSNDSQLERKLGPMMLWGLGVGYVISGMYFGWNLGLPQGGSLGFGIALFFVIIMYSTFSFCYTELACAIPKAGGAFDYAKKAMGPSWGFFAGMTQNIEFIFAPPAIAFAIGAYLNKWFPGLNIESIAIAAYLLFTTINILGVKIAAAFELIVTIIAVAELLLFAGITLPHFEAANLAIDYFPHGLSGIFAAIPFAIWFFLAIEGIANVAEETINPQRNVVIGFGSALFTLILLCLLTFISAVGVGGWPAIVFQHGDTNMSDSPLPLALAQVVGFDTVMMHLLIGIGIFGLVASFHGIILAAGRATYEFGREGMAPGWLATTHKRFKTPANALLLNMVIGVIAIGTGKTADIITIACFGALGLYVLSMIAYLLLRINEPELARPYKAPMYPFFPIIALVISTIALIAMTWLNLKLALIYYSIMLLSFLSYKLLKFL